MQQKTCQLMQNHEISTQLTEAFQAFSTFVEEHQGQWNHRPSAERWSMGQHAEHLWLSGLGSASVLKQADAFFANFGPTGRPPRSYEELEQQYFSVVAGGVVAPPKQTPPADYTKSPAAFLKDWKALEEKTLQRFATNWTAAKMEEKTLPHPALGLVSIREFLYSVSFHVHHHIKTLTKEYL